MNLISMSIIHGKELDASVFLTRIDTDEHRIDVDFLATEGTEASEIRSKEVGHEESLIADFADCTDLSSVMTAADSQMTTGFFTLRAVKAWETSHSQMTMSFFMLQSWMLDFR